MAMGLVGQLEQLTSSSYKGLSMPKKKLIPIIAVILVLLVGGGVFAFTQLRGNDTAPEQQQTQKKRVAVPENVIPVAERPYLKIAPKDARNLTLSVVEVKKAADAVEYELEYQAGTLLQGAFGELELDSLPAEKTILLGSCSAGGACTYHEDIQGGSLLTRFSGPELYALKSDWRYFDNKTRETAVGSKDAKFQLESTDLATERYIIVFNNAGYPEGLEGTPISDPYSLSTVGTVSGTGTLTLRANEEGGSQIMGWDGKAWHEFETTVDGKTLTAEVDLMELYIAVK
jgi:hypothetical protein